MRGNHPNARKLLDYLEVELEGKYPRPHVTRAVFGVLTKLFEHGHEVWDTYQLEGVAFLPYYEIILLGFKDGEILMSLIVTSEAALKRVLRQAIGDLKVAMDVNRLDDLSGREHFRNREYFRFYEVSRASLKTAKGHSRLLLLVSL